MHPSPPLLQLKDGAAVTSAAASKPRLGAELLARLDGYLQQFLEGAYDILMGQVGGCQADGSRRGGPSGLHPAGYINPWAPSFFLPCVPVGSLAVAASGLIVRPKAQGTHSN